LARLRLEKIGFVFQTFNLLATLSAYENVELPMIMLGKLDAKERKAKAKELLGCTAPHFHYRSMTHT
jgi:putative ABC transport system ATP-binding protein